jgi:hypothetical protein
VEFGNSVRVSLRRRPAMMHMSRRILREPVPRAPMRPACGGGSPGCRPHSVVVADKQDGTRSMMRDVVADGVADEPAQPVLA